jgi:hypothetical protein
VTVVRVDTGFVVTTLALNTDYSVLLNANQDTSPGGLVTLAAALPTGYKLTISSAIPYTQPVVFGSTVNIQTLNDSFDRMVALIQQLNARLGASGVAGGVGLTNGMPTDFPTVPPGTVILRADNGTVGAAFLLWALFPGAASWVALQAVA